MEYRVATLDEIRATFFTKTQDALEALLNFADVWLCAPAQDAEIDLKKLAVVCGFIPGKITRGEFGGRGSLAERHGFWKIQVSSQFGTDINLGWELAQELENAFLPFATEELPIISKIPDDPVCSIFCDFPYTEFIGETPDKRIGITVTIPFWTWTTS